MTLYPSLYSAGTLNILVHEMHARADLGFAKERGLPHAVSYL